MKSYKIQVKHDHGEQGFLIRADSIQEAKEIVMRLEGCPERAGGADRDTLQSDRIVK